MRRERSARAWLPLGLGLGLVLGVTAGGVGACFNAPRPAVQFSCDETEAPECPAGYTCQPDGCCHLDGSDYAAFEGRCQLGGVPPSPTSGGSTAEPSTASDTTDATDTGSTATGSTGSTTDDHTTETGSSSEAASTGHASSGSTSSG